MLVTLVSGGLDSFIASRLAGESLRVFVDLGQPYAIEETITVQNLFPDVNIVKVRGLPDPTEITIPARNLFLATIALRWGNEIIIAGVKDEKFLDKNKSAFEKMSEVLTKICGYEVTVSSNVFDYTKVEAVAEYLKRGFDPKDLLKTFSCYKPTHGSQCYDCEACYRRWFALAENGIESPKISERIMSGYGEKKRNFRKKNT